MSETVHHLKFNMITSNKVYHEKKEKIVIREKWRILWPIIMYIEVSKMPKIDHRLPYEK